MDSTESTTFWLIVGFPIRFRAYWFYLPSFLYRSHLSGISLESHWDLESLWPWGLTLPEQEMWGQFLKVINSVDLPLFSKPQELVQRSCGKCQARNWILPAQQSAVSRLKCFVTEWAGCPLCTEQLCCLGHVRKPGGWCSHYLTAPPWCSWTLEGAQELEEGLRLSPPAMRWGGQETVLSTLTAVLQIRRAGCLVRRPKAQTNARTVPLLSRRWQAGTSSLGQSHVFIDVKALISLLFK